MDLLKKWDTNFGVARDTHNHQKLLSAAVAVATAVTTVVTMVVAPATAVATAALIILNIQLMFQRARRSYFIW